MGADLKRKLYRLGSYLMPIRMLLKRYRFSHEDIGDLGNIADTDIFIISLPKCGTTSLAHGFRKMNKLVIHTHNDETGFRSLTNGLLLRRRGLGLARLLKYRLENTSRDILVLSGFRDPVSWYISMAQQFNVDLADSLKDNIVANMRAHEPWYSHRPSVQFELIRECTGIDIFDFYFDQQQGLTVIKRDRVTLVLYRIDALDSVEALIGKDFISGYKMNNGRITEDPAYIGFRNRFKLDESVIDDLFDNKFVSYFYNDTQKSNLKKKYVKE